MEHWEALPPLIQERIARRLPPRDMRSLGRVSRSGRRAANRAHAERVASIQRGLADLRANPRMAAFMKGRSLKTRVLAAVLTAVEVGWTASLSRLRRAGFQVGPYQGNPPQHEATKTFAMPGGVSVTTEIIRMAAHGGHDYEHDGVYVTVDYPNYYIEFSVEPNGTVRWSFHSEVLARALLSDVVLIASVKAGLARRGIDLLGS